MLKAVTARDSIVYEWNSKPTGDFCLYKSIPFEGTMIDVAGQGWEVLHEAVKDLYLIEGRKTKLRCENILELRDCIGNVYGFHIYKDKYVVAVSPANGGIEPYVPYSICKELESSGVVDYMKCQQKHRCGVFSFTSNKDEFQKFRDYDMLWHLYCTIHGGTYLYLEVQNTQGKSLILNRGLRVPQGLRENMSGVMKRLRRMNRDMFLKLDFEDSEEMTHSLLDACDTFYPICEKDLFGIRKELKKLQGGISDPVLLLEEFTAKMIKNRHYVFELPSIALCVSKILKSKVSV